MAATGLRHLRTRYDLNSLRKRLLAVGGIRE